MEHSGKRLLAFFLALSMLLSFAACGGETTAATMHLIKTEGTVQVNDAKGKSLKVMENLGLFSGYSIATQMASYGWVNLDDTKLAKLDESSEAEVRKDGKLLELYVRSGSLFFNVTKPLSDDETLDIRTSTMLVGIRGTCGWVEVANESLMCVYLLRGKVECTVMDSGGGVLASQTITAGQAAKMEADGSITVAEFDMQNLPGFVADEIGEDGQLAGSDPDSGESGADDTSEPLPSMTPEVTAALEQYRAIVTQAGTYDYGMPSLPEERYLGYDFALALMQTEYEVPALLLRQTNGLYGERPNYTLVFQYDPASGTVVQASEPLENMFGRDEYKTASGVHGIFAQIAKMPINSSGEVRPHTWYALDGGTLVREVLTMAGNNAPANVQAASSFQYIHWYGISDNYTYGLDSWTPETADVP